MIIRKMTARFGKLNGSTIELSSGMNVVYAPNESGKSTWCAFIRAMLYGIDSSQRRRGGFVPDKVIYTPWSGVSLQGSMDVEEGELKLTLRRSSKTENAPMREFSAIYSGTQNVYPLTGATAGDELTGVSREVFSRSAFIGQGVSSVDNSPELESRIAAIVSTGEERMSFSDIDSKLRLWQRKRRHNNRVGAIPELTDELTKLDRRLSDLTELTEKSRLLAMQVEALSEKRSELLCRLEHERAVAGSASKELLHRESEVVTEVSSAEEAERICREKLDSGRFGSRDPREVVLEIDRVKSAVKRLRDSGANEYSNKKLILPALLLVIAAALSVFGFLDAKAAFIPAAVLLILAVLTAINSAKVSKTARDAMAQYRAVLRQYSVDNEQELYSLGDEHRNDYEQWQRSAEALREKRRKLEVLRAESAHRISIVPTENKELSDVTLRLSACREELAALGGRMDVTGDPAVLESERNRLRDAIAEDYRQLEELDGTRELLAAADREQQSKFSPQLTHRTTELFKKMTGGRYTELSFDRELNAYARIEGDTLGHEAAFMSEGTKNLMYLALRLAICELAFPEGKSCPIILDDALSSLDEKRLGAAVDLLYELSKERQIILFTCHRREAEYLKARSDANILEETL